MVFCLCKYTSNKYQLFLFVNQAYQSASFNQTEARPRRPQNAWEITILILKSIPNFNFQIFDYLTKFLLKDSKNISLKKFNIYQSL